ncbi:MAG TPA: potassium channel family protein, partial [Gemmataceae bacterium]|nr:potassium channel family protein [Gemmataceae bacterium]
LLTLLAMLVVTPVLETTSATRLLFGVLFTLVFLASLPVIFTDRRLRLAALLLGVPTVVGVWTGYILPGLPRLPLAVGFHILAAVFFGFTIAAILRGIHREKDVSAEAISAALCGYILTGVVFGHLYTLVELLAPASFTGEGFAEPKSDERHHLLLTYFSFITLTTTGYGDITPRGALARGLAMAEAIVGQFYIAVLVADLIGKRVSQVLTPRKDGTGEPPPTPPG